MRVCSCVFVAVAGTWAISLYGCATVRDIIAPPSPYLPWARRHAMSIETGSALPWVTRTFRFGDASAERYLTYSVMNGRCMFTGEDEDPDRSSDATAKPTIIFVHGITSFRSTWGPIGRVFAEDYGCQVILVDLLGHGDSGKPKDCHYGIATQGRILARFIRSLHDQGSIDRAVLVGISYGAGSALEAARQLALCSDLESSYVARSSEPIGGRFVCDPDYPERLTKMDKCDPMCPISMRGICNTPPAPDPHKTVCPDENPTVPSANSPVAGVVMLDSAVFYCDALAQDLCKMDLGTTAWDKAKRSAARPGWTFLLPWSIIEEQSWKRSISVDARAPFETRKELEYYYDRRRCRGLKTRSAAISKATVDYISELRYRARDGYDDTKRYCGVTCPVLVMFGDHSDLVPEPLVWQLYRSLPNADLRKVLDCGHGIPAEKPHQTVMAIREFLRDPDIGWAMDYGRPEEPRFPDPAAMLRWR